MSGYDLTGVVPYAACAGDGDGEECDPLTDITTGPINNGTVGVPFEQEMAAVGQPPIVWNQEFLVWPDGISQDPDTGTISGTPTTPVSEHIVTLKVTDAYGHTAWKLTSMTVEA